MTSSLFTGITSGLNSTFSILTSASSSGVTLASIASAQSSTTYASSLNNSFTSYIESNFATLDTDHNGVLSASELSKLTSSITATGLTSSQLSQLGSASGLSNETLEQVLDHFTDIDTNGDGKVTSSEIQAYKLTSAMEKEKTEFRNKAAADQSMFYGDDTSSSTADSSSMLSFKYWNDGSSSSSSSSS